MAQRQLVIVPHTHWDREWYRTHEEFRYRLVRMLDGLLDLLEREPDFLHFTLDGQVIVLDDYLEVRPEARDRIVALIRAGRLLIGPWYVLPDEWLVSGEALIRNLRLGLARAAEFGGAMALGYVPDQFGHVGQLPQIFAGFGFDSAALWRGVGDDIDQPLFAWEAPDGTRLVTVYLKRSYSNAANLPLAAAELAQRLGAEMRAWSPDANPVLLMNGSDHLEPQSGLPRALTAAAAELGDVSIEIGTLPGFAQRARREWRGELQLHRGELRSGLRSPLLEGCASARISQKRSDFLNDRLLTRYLEPLASWLDVLGGDADPAILELAWRVALQNHPHDSICGCSVDAVHAQMETRFARVREIAGAHLARTLGELGSLVRALPAAGRGETLIAWNPGATGRAEVEGEIELDIPGSARRPVLHLVDATGARIALDAERIEPGVTLAEYTLPASAIATITRGLPPEFIGRPVVDLSWRRPQRGGDHALEIDAVFGTEAAVDFDFAAAKTEILRVLDAEGSHEVRFRARQRSRFRLRFVDMLPGCGLRVYRLARGRAKRRGDPPGAIAEATQDGGVTIQNDAWRVTVDSSGRVDFHELRSGVQMRDALRFVSAGDRGDEYNFDPVPGDRPVERPQRARVRLLPRSEAAAGVEIRFVYRVPAALVPDRTARSGKTVALPVTARIRLPVGLDRIDITVELSNTARDHRLRAHLRGPAGANRLEVESAFEIASRPIAPAPGDFGSERPAEFPIGATPQRSFATLAGEHMAATLASRGSPEVEAVVEPDGSVSLAVTLVRAVGWLSRDDLALRPGHAGPPLATPGAQVPGPHRAELSYRLHPTGADTRASRAHHFAYPPLVFTGGRPVGRLADGDRLIECDDPAVVVSAIEPRRQNSPIFRLVNLSADPRRPRLRWNGGSGGLEAVDLTNRRSASDGPRLEPAGEGAFHLTLRPWQIITLRPV